MDSTVIPPAADPLPQTQSFQVAYNVLRSAQADGVRLVKLLDDATAQRAGQPNASDEGFVRARRLLVLAYSKDSQEMEQRLQALEDWATGSPAEASRITLSMQHFRNTWQLIAGLWPADDQWTRQAVEGLSNDIRPLLYALVETCAYVTVPTVAVRFLNDMHGGGVLDFDDKFMDETIDRAMRVSLFKRFQSSTRAFPGFFNESSLTIVKLDRRVRMIALKAGLMVLVVISPLLLLGILDLASVGDLVDRFLGDRGYGAIVGFMVAALLGAFVHFLVDMWKAKSVNRAIGIERALDWFLVHYGSVCWAIGAVWVALSIFLWTNDDKAATLSGVTVFFIGYFADSIAEVALDRFTTAANSIEATLRERAQS